MSIGNDAGLYFLWPVVQSTPTIRSDILLEIKIDRVKPEVRLISVQKNQLRTKNTYRYARHNKIFLFITQSDFCHDQLIFPNLTVLQIFFHEVSGLSFQSWAASKEELFVRANQAEREASGRLVDCK